MAEPVATGEAVSTLASNVDRPRLRLTNVDDFAMKEAHTLRDARQALLTPSAWEASHYSLTSYCEPDNDRFLPSFIQQTEWKQYSEYQINVDPDQDDKASEIKLCSFARPHMRAFHCSWWGFFIAFFIWFAIAPLLSEIRDDLGITKKDVWTANIIGVGSTIMMRFLMGPLCDKFGGKSLPSP